MVEAAIYLADPMFMEEKLVNYPHSFWLAVIADDLMTAFLVYTESGLPRCCGYGVGSFACLDIWTNCTPKM